MPSAATAVRPDAQIDPDRLVQLGEEIPDLLQRHLVMLGEGSLGKAELSPPSGEDSCFYLN